LKLVLTGAIKESMVPKDVIADYLLFCLNRANIKTYVEIWGLERPTEDIGEVLTKIAKRLGARRGVDEWDTDAAATAFVKKYRQGELGSFDLDDIP